MIRKAIKLKKTGTSDILNLYKREAMVLNQMINKRSKQQSVSRKASPRGQVGSDIIVEVSEDSSDPSAGKLSKPKINIIRSRTISVRQPKETLNISDQKGLKIEKRNTFVTKNYEKLT